MRGPYGCECDANFRNRTLNRIGRSGSRVARRRRMICTRHKDRLSAHFPLCNLRNNKTKTGGPDIVHRVLLLVAVCLAFVFGLSADPLAQMAGGKKGKRDSSQPRDETTPEKKGRLPSAEIDNPDFVPRPRIGQSVIKAAREHGGPESIERGMFITGLTQKFAEGIFCRDVDDYWAKDYSQNFGGYHVHGGMDIPVPFGTPVHAVADGEVVLKSLHLTNPDGIQIWLRHSPQDTGLPMWTFTQYAHLRELPDLPLGQRVQMGDVIGITSNSGSAAPAGSPSALQQAQKPSRGMLVDRRPAIHFAVMYNESGKYFRNEQFIVPLDFRWMDPNAIYRKEPPYDSASMKSLPKDQKQVPIPYMLPDGTKVPADTKLIWPYPCSKTLLPPAMHK